MDEKLLKSIADDMSAVKKLMILDLAKQGVSLTKIAAALDVHKSTVARMFPSGTVDAVVKD
ncbi:helix-turn-helix domain-containing protein [Hellea sp.]|nr:helix-turn-helix domain-containing protein [Hellea sp.]